MRPDVKKRPPSSGVSPDKYDRRKQVNGLGSAVRSRGGAAHEAIPLHQRADRLGAPAGEERHPRGGPVDSWVALKPPFAPGRRSLPTSE